MIPGSTHIAPLLVLLAGCGGSAVRQGSSSGALSGSFRGVPVTTSGGEELYAETTSAVEVEADDAPPASPEPAARGSLSPMAGGGGLLESLFGSEDGRGDDSVTRREENRQEDRRIAQNLPARRREPPASPPSPPTQTPTGPETPEQARTADDATSGPLLIYEATLNLAVYQVQDNQRAVIQVAQELGGYLAQQNDRTVIVRVPAAKFHEALGRIEALGDVLHRNIQALDVSEQFRDLQIRLRNAEQVRDRLAALLEQSRNVEESLQIERELERLTTEIETMKGRLRFLEDRISFSTVTVNFQPREQENLEGEIFHLPFDWLYNLGLRTLLNLR